MATSQSPLYNPGQVIWVAFQQWLVIFYSFFKHLHILLFSLGQLNWIQAKAASLTSASSALSSIPNMGLNCQLLLKSPSLHPLPPSSLWCREITVSFASRNAEGMDTVKAEEHSQTQGDKKKKSILNRYIFFNLLCFRSLCNYYCTEVIQLCRLCSASGCYVIPEELHALRGNALWSGSWETSVCFLSDTRSFIHISPSDLAQSSRSKVSSLQLCKLCVCSRFLSLLFFRWGCPFLRWGC